jgi:putative PIN family toxin of toxin-antitoxin system
MSGIFFRGAPGQILEAWRDGRVLPVLSVAILVEYDRVGRELAHRYPGVDPAPLIELIATRGELYHVPPLPERVCEDPDDDKFLACALASRCRLVVSGDRALLRASGYGGVRVVRPRRFLDDMLDRP